MQFAICCLGECRKTATENYLAAFWALIGKVENYAVCRPNIVYLIANTIYSNLNCSEAQQKQQRQHFTVQMFYC